MRATELGEFLRAARAKIDPDDLGLPSFGTRRVAGLRREEVATLAGISADYYTRLEQGRERNPSGQVVDAIGRALRLDTDAREHLLRLAGVIPSAIRSTTTEELDPNLFRLLDALHDVGAYITNRVLDILAMNALAKQLFSPLGDVEHANLARLTFCNPESRTVLADWHAAADSVVQTLRLASGYEPRGPLNALVEELRAGSAEFDELWRANTPRSRTRIVNTINHDEVGPITFTSLSFDVRGSTGQHLVLVFPETGTQSARSFELLSALPAQDTSSDP